MFPIQQYYGQNMYIVFECLLVGVMGICGDGLLQEEDCDDGNVKDADGCSSGCQVEGFFYCDGQPSVCKLNIELMVGMNSYHRTGCNCLQIVLAVLPVLPASVAVVDNLHITNDYIVINKAEYQDGELTVQACYTDDMMEAVTVDVFGYNTTFTYEDQVPTVFYTPQQCDNVELLEKYMIGLQVVGWMVMTASLFTHKIVGLQLMGLLQLCQISLQPAQTVPLYGQPLGSLVSVHGPNSIQHPSSTFTQHFNIMYVITVLFIAICLVIFIKAQDVGRPLLKQGILTIITFNLYNLAFSSTLGGDALDQYLMGMMWVMVLGVFGGRFCSSDKGYGEYYRLYKQSGGAWAFVSVLGLYRIVLGCWIGLGLYSYVLVGVWFMMFYVCSVQPFISSIYNIWLIVVRIAELTILLHGVHFQTTSLTMSREAHNHSYAIWMFAVIGICVIFSTLLVIYQLLLLFLSCCPQQVSPEPENHQQTHQDIVQPQTLQQLTS